MGGYSERILTTHVGSLIRPPELIGIYQQMERALDGGPSIDEDTYERCLAKSVVNVVQQQATIGVDVASDGEFGKSWTWANYAIDRLSGLEHQELKPGQVFRSPIHGKDRRDFAAFYAEYDPTRVFFGRQHGRSRRWVVTGPIKYTGHKALKRDIENFKTGLRTANVSGGFLTAVAPGSLLPEREDEFYRTEEEGLFAVAEAMRDEYKAIVDAGLILQVDDAYLASWYDMMLPQGSLEDYRKWAAVRVEALNFALKGIPEDRTRFHMCWGSWNGPHTTDVPLRAIVDLVLKIRVGGYVLEMANARHEHEWRIWESAMLPKGRKLVPGVISHQTNVVEHPELVAERIVRLAKLVGRENVIAGSDCGFSPGPFLRRFHPSIMWAKLGSLARGAQLATRELWPR
jgi:5-methyltetrahydropteroyltriglutamate--homocysteine methyltransferase